ncbi:hypothetical protein B0H13DRAFT_2306053 [Mycena leptocephala]|nr:hypothetical protein B0H13DRAFT_2306053 [Mycena leptocephala]
MEYPDPEVDDDDGDLDCPPDFWINRPYPASSSSGRLQKSGPLSDMDYKKLQSKRRRHKSRLQVQAANGTPGLKQITVKRQQEALGRAIYAETDVEGLEHSKPGYINWDGMLSIPIIDCHGRIIAVLGGMPRDYTGWKIVTDAAAKLMEDKAHRLSHSEEQLHHRRAQEPYPAVARGVSHGGGQTAPGNLKHNMKNTKVTDELLAHDPS